jgi:hypothetical protein
LTSIKPLGELVLVIEKSEKCWDKAATLAKWAWEQFEEGDLILRILIASPDLIVISTIYASFRKLGFRNERLETIIKYYLETGYCKGLELPEWRRLDVRHASVSLGLSDQKDLSLGRSCLRERPEPWMLSTGYAYAITHELFYITDFGNRKANIDPCTIAYLRISINVWLRIFHREKNYDLVSELLMSARYLGFLELYDDWIPNLVEWQREDGCFPGPEGSAKNIMDDSMNCKRIDFLRNYHTTLVAVLALIDDSATY